MRIITKTGFSAWKINREIKVGNENTRSTANAIRSSESLNYQGEWDLLKYFIGNAYAKT